MAPGGENAWVGVVGWGEGEGFWRGRLLEARTEEWLRRGPVMRWPPECRFVVHGQSPLNPACGATPHKCHT